MQRKRWVARELQRMYTNNCDRRADRATVPRHKTLLADRKGATAMDSASIGLNLIQGTHPTGHMHRLHRHFDPDKAVDSLIQSKDKDGDGTLSPQEIGISDATFKQADTNGDGQLDASEIKNNAQAILKDLTSQNRQSNTPSDGATQQLIQALDSSGDGKLSRDELGISQEAFDKADTNGDGKLSFDELKAGAKAIGRELAARDAAIRQYLSPDYLEADADDKTTVNLVV
jgi:Ca2+-binding EF-hand superfamily protein